ncbi:hypothetical protein BDN72DRAFT_929374, partial [Pluteus cervinus]
FTIETVQRSIHTLWFANGINTLPGKRPFVLIQPFLSALSVALLWFSQVILAAAASTMSSILTTSSDITPTPLNIQHFTSSPSMVSLWDHLPMELEDLILRYASANLPNHIVPIHFGLVSRHWRALTLGIHNWWAEVDISLDIKKASDFEVQRQMRKVQSAHQWLSRAGKQITKVRIYHCWLDWRDSEPARYHDLYQQFFKDGVLSYIRHLRLDVDHEIFRCIIHALDLEGGDDSVLEEVHTGDATVRPGRLLFDQLTHLGLGNNHSSLSFSEDILPVLRYTSQLRSLTMSIKGWDDDRIILTPSIILPKLEELHIRVLATMSSGRVWNPPAGNLVPLFRSLTVPSLKNLCIRDIPSYSLPCGAQTLLNFHHRSGFSLRKLRLEYVRCDGPRFIPFLQSLSDLEELELFDCELNHKDLFRALQTTPILPRLHAFGLLQYGDADEFDVRAQDIIQTITSRWRDHSDLVVKWKNVSILIPPFKDIEMWDKTSRNVLEKLQGEGMDLNVISSYLG